MDVSGSDGGRCSGKIRDNTCIKFKAKTVFDVTPCILVDEYQ
jgi:hypothetical protein